MAITTQYAIDGSPVNSRIDWQLVWSPRPADKRDEYYPGQPERYVVTGPPKPILLQIRGTLMAASLAALRTQIDTYRKMDGDGLEHSVTIKDLTYSAMSLSSFSCGGTYYPISNADGSYLGIDVIFQWSQLREEVVSA